MLDSSDITQVKQQIDQYEAWRDEIITKGRALIKRSKKVIYALHRDDMDYAKEQVQLINNEKQALVKLTSHHPNLGCEGSFRVAMQEYVEALTYFYYLTEKRIPTSKELDVSAQLYILGICDVTGELVRRAVRAATKEQFGEVVEIKDTLENIFGTLLEFEFRDNETRRKFDSIKYDLKKVEELVLELKLKGLL